MLARRGRAGDLAVGGAQAAAQRRQFILHRPLCIVENAVALGLDAVAPLGEIAADRFGFIARNLFGALRRLQLVALLLEVREQTLDVSGFGRRVRAGALQHPSGHTQALRDGDRVRAARRAHQQAVGGLQRLSVELGRGVDDPRRRMGEDFERPVMRGGHNRRFELEQILEQRAGQRRAFGGVGARAQLVEQHQRLGSALSQDADDVW